MHGRVALEIFSPGTGPHVLESAGRGRGTGLAVADPAAPVAVRCPGGGLRRVVSLDSACLRGKCDADLRLGCEFLQRVAQVMSHRLDAARVRLLDLYGIPRPGTGSRADRS